MWRRGPVTLMSSQVHPGKFEGRESTPERTSMSGGRWQEAPCVMFGSLRRESPSSTSVWTEELSCTPF